MRTALLALAALVSTAPLASATSPPSPGPLVGVCVDGVTSDGCYGGAWICVGFSYQVPFCVEHPVITCTELCSPCTWIHCPALADVCVAGVTDPDCYGYHDVCVSVSRQVPICADVPDVECSRVVCDPCYVLIDCDPLPPIAASGPEPQCLYWYWELDTGVVRYVHRDSCHSELWVDGERVR